MNKNRLDCDKWRAGSLVVEYRVRNAEVGGSIPFRSTRNNYTVHTNIKVNESFQW